MDGRGHPHHRWGGTGSERLKMGEQLSLDELLQAAESRCAQGSGVHEGEHLHGVRHLVPLHLPLQDREEFGLGDPFDLQGPIFGQDGAKAEVGGIEVGAVLADEPFELPSTLRGAEDGFARATKQVAGVMGEASVKASRERAGRLRSPYMFSRCP